MSNAYITFSERNQLPDEEFGIIANYLERVLGWDLKYEFKNNYHYFTNNPPKKKGYTELLGITDYEGKKKHMKVYFLGANGSKAMFDGMPFEIFFPIHTAILPAVRDFLHK